MKKLFMFAAMLFALAGCNEYNDAELRGRVDELEDRVEAHEQWLQQLQNSINSLNNANSAFTALANGGLITNVTTTEDGITITVTKGDGSTQEYTVKNGEKGDRGETGEGLKGDKGEDGETPEIGFGYEEGKGFYWTLNGEPMEYEGEVVYVKDGEPGKPGEPGTAGGKGDTGAQGWTPLLKIEKDPNAGPGDEDTLYWWVGYDKNNDGKISEADGEKWENLKVGASSETATASGVDVEYDEDEGKITFTKNGETVVEYYINQTPESSFSIKVEVSEDDTHFYVGEVKQYAYTVEGLEAGNYVVKAEMLKNDGSFSVVDIDDEYVYVKANKSGADLKNTINIEVIEQNGTCYHTYFEIAADIPTVSLSDDSLNQLVVTDLKEDTKKEIGIWLYTDMPDAGIELTVSTSMTDALKINPEYDENSITWGNYGDATPCYYNIIDTDFEEGKAYIPVFTFKAKDGQKVHFANGEDELTCSAVVGKTMKKYIYTESDATTKWTHSGEGDGLAGLCDDNPDTYWHSLWAVSQSTPTDPVYGVYIDVAIKSNIKAVSIKYTTRANPNATPAAIIIGEVKQDGVTELGAENEDLPTGAQESYQTNAYRVSDIESVRFGVTESKQGSLLEDLFTHAEPSQGWVYCNSVSLSELEIYVLE